MNAWLATARIIVEIALRNLVASRWKTLIVGGIIGFGALLVVVGSSLLDAVDRAMRHSITSSIAGHIQVYSADSTDELEIMGNVYVDVPDIAPLEDFARVRTTLLSVPNVQAVVPMGFADAVASSGNAVDQAIDRLRASMDARDTSSDPARAEALTQAYAAEKDHTRQIVQVLRREIDDAKNVSERSVSDDEAHALARASSDAFWADFDADPVTHLEFLDGRIASLAADADMLYLRNVGTDPAVFARAFDRMQIVDGAAIPSGERGFLFSKLVYEEQVKLRAARELDHIRSGIDDRRRTIAQDPDLQRMVRDNVNGVNELLLQLDATKTASFQRKLQKLLSSQEADVGKLLASFFRTTDQNFAERYAFFYRELVPELQLYRVKVGDTITIKTLTRSGYMQAANVKVYGTYVFKGLEKSPQAGAISMLDLVTFRELYGFVTADREQELEAMRAAAGAVDIGRDAAEAELFGSKPAVEAAIALPDHQHAKRPKRGVARSKPRRSRDRPSAAPEVTAAPPADDRLSTLRGVRTRQEERSSSYDPKQLEQGPILNAAVLVRDESKIDDTIDAINAAGKRAGLPLKAISWQKAAGIIGQFATLMRAILFSAVAIIFVVALVVINNALVMATLERVNEVGTLRAIGAQRRFILSMLVVESLVIGISSGSLGALLGGLILLVLGRVGIPAQSDVMTFFFSGPRLFPDVTFQQLGFSLITVVVVSLISGLYPALLAMRVSPREAMHSAD